LHDPTEEAAQQDIERCKQEGAMLKMVGVCIPADGLVVILQRALNVAVFAAHIAPVAESGGIQRSWFANILYTDVYV
jgi:hypothetical protein